MRAVFGVSTTTERSLGLGARTDLYLSGVCQPGLVGDVVVDLKPVVRVTVKVAVVDGDLLNTRETVASRDAIARRVAFNRTFSRRRLRTTFADP